MFGLFKKKPAVTAEDAAAYGFTSAAEAFAKLPPGSDSIRLTLVELADMQQAAYTRGMADMVEMLQRVRGE